MTSPIGRTFVRRTVIASTTLVGVVTAISLAIGSSAGASAAKTPVIKTGRVATAIPAGRATSTVATVLPTGALSVRGADISSALAEEAAGTSLSLNGTALPIEQILSRSGANYVRLRLWVNPTEGDSTETTALALARRAHSAGLKIFLDLHYSDWWADPTTQTIPAAWAGQSLTQLVSTVRSYTAHVMRDFEAQGTPASMIEIGNEINAGILWPVGQIQPDGTGNWSNLAQLLNAGIAGARSVNPAVTVVLHTALGTDNAAATYFYYRIISAGVTDFDVVGLSYYPFWQSSLTALGTNLQSLASRFQRPVLIVETSYPWTVQTANPQSWVSSTAQLPDSTAYPPTPAGQAAYFGRLRQVLQSVPGGRGLGFLDWEPGWLPGVAAVPGATTPAFANLTMFDYRGRALPAVQTAFARPVT